MSAALRHSFESFGAQGADVGPAVPAHRNALERCDRNADRGGEPRLGIRAQRLRPRAGAAVRAQARDPASEFRTWRSHRPAASARFDARSASRSATRLLRSAVSVVRIGDIKERLLHLGAHLPDLLRDIGLGRLGLKRSAAMRARALAARAAAEIRPTARRASRRSPPAAVTYSPKRLRFGFGRSAAVTLAGRGRERRARASASCGFKSERGPEPFLAAPAGCRRPADRQARRPGGARRTPAHLPWGRPEQRWCRRRTRRSDAQAARSDIVARQKHRRRLPRDAGSISLQRRLPGKLPSIARQYTDFSRAASLLLRACVRSDTPYRRVRVAAGRGVTLQARPPTGTTSNFRSSKL